MRGSDWLRCQGKTCRQPECLFCLHFGILNSDYDINIIRGWTLGWDGQPHHYLLVF